MRARHTLRHSRRRNPRQELRVHGAIPWQTHQAGPESRDVHHSARTYHLDMGWQGDAIKHVGINQGIISRKEDMTGQGQARYERSGTALAVVVEGIAETTLGRGVAVVEGVE